MCSPSDCGQVPEPHGPLEFSEVKACRKCGSSALIVLDKIHVECRHCFLESCRKKLRSTIGKSKLLRNNDSILLAYSGGASSEALLSLISDSINCDTRREQKFRPSILHIDTQIITPLNSHPVTDEERRQKLADLLGRVHERFPDWPLYWTTLESVALKSATDHDVRLFYRYEPENSTLTSGDLRAILGCQELIESFKSRMRGMDLTDMNAYVAEKCCKLMDVVATMINFSLENVEDRFKYVFTASSSTKLANDLLVGVILGNETGIHSTVSICDRRRHVPVMRPMRDFSKKEITFYLRAISREPHVQTNLLTFADRKASIQSATEAFLSKLYIDYPSTYSTLLRTGTKMQD